MAKKRVRASAKARGAGKGKSPKNFCDFLKERTDNIANELADLGMKIKEGKKESTNDRYIDLLGFIWPLISAAFGIFLLVLTIIVLNIMNIRLENYFISALAAFFYNNLYLFFAISLFFGYADFIEHKFSQVYWVVEPVIMSMGVISVLWIFAMALHLVNPYPQANFFITFANVIYLNLDRVFFIFLIFGYAILLYKIIIREACKSKK